MTFSSFLSLSLLCQIIQPVSFLFLFFLHFAIARERALREKESAYKVLIVKRREKLWKEALDRMCVGVCLCAGCVLSFFTERCPAVESQLNERYIYETLRTKLNLHQSEMRSWYSEPQHCCEKIVRSASQGGLWESQSSPSRPGRGNYQKERTKRRIWSMQMFPLSKAWTKKQEFEELPKQLETGVEVGNRIRIKKGMRVRFFKKIHSLILLF